MPIKNAQRTVPALQYYRNTSYETLAVSWFTRDGWEVFLPVIDHGQKTDLVVAEGAEYYRIQIKSVETSDENAIVENKWGEENISYVIYFSRTADWGYIALPFTEKQKKLNSPDHIRFNQDPQHFIEAFKSI